MVITGLFFLPTLPGSVSSSPSDSLLSRISYKFPAQPHEPFHVDHRLFFDTSSLLPTSASTGTSVPHAQRQFTQFLTTSHRPKTTYVGVTSSTDPAEMAIVTIPASAQDGFCNLIVTKMQPQWALRQSVSLDGSAVVLPLKDNAMWTIRIGDLRSAAGAGKAGTTAASAAGNNRGLVIEVQVEQACEDDLPNQDPVEVYEFRFRSLIETLFKDIRDLKLEQANLLVKQTVRREGRTDPSDSIESPEGSELAKLYMSVLRNTRS